MNIEVWAPSAISVDLVLAERRVPLHLEAMGYWRTQIEEPMLSGGYRFSIDAADPIPDPRSRWQPDGVHGASHLAPAPAPAPAPEPASAERNHAGGLERAGLRNAVIYEIHIGTFTAEGTYEAAQAKLPYLAELGVTHLELMPLAAFPGQRGWGYDGVALYAPFAPYGTPQQLSAFVQACHAHGLAVLLDVVYNHLGPDGNYLGRFGPYFTDRYATGWGAALNYDGPQSDGVRRFAIDNALMWLRDFGFDGLRLDAVHAIYSFGAMHVLEEMSEAVHTLGAQLGRELVLIAESDLNDPRLVRPASRGGYGLDAQWADDFHHAIHRFFTGENSGYYADFNGLEDVAAALRHGFVYRGQFSAFRGRRHGRGEVPPAHQLVVFAQNHDQVGNRAQGERLSMLVDTARLKAIAALTLLSPFAALLFQGEEWGARTPFLYFTDHENAELGRLVAEGRSREFAAFAWQGAVPDPQLRDTFEHSKLNWTEAAVAAHAGLLDWHRRLIRLRRERGAAPKARVRFDARAGWLRFECGGVLAAFNFADRPQRVRLAAGDWHCVLDSHQPPDDTMGPLPAFATRIFRRRGPV